MFLFRYLTHRFEHFNSHITKWFHVVVFHKSQFLSPLLWHDRTQFCSHASKITIRKQFQTVTTTECFFLDLHCFRLNKIFGLHPCVCHPPSVHLHRTWPNPSPLKSTPPADLPLTIETLFPLPTCHSRQMCPCPAPKIHDWQATNNLSLCRQTKLESSRNVASLGLG